VDGDPLCGIQRVGPISARGGRCGSDLRHHSTHPVLIAIVLAIIIVIASAVVPVGGAAAAVGLRKTGKAVIVDLRRKDVSQHQKLSSVTSDFSFSMTFATKQNTMCDKSM
jgi:hypothetical protein